MKTRWMVLSNGEIESISMLLQNRLQAGNIIDTAEQSQRSLLFKLQQLYKSNSSSFKSVELNIIELDVMATLLVGILADYPWSSITDDISHPDYCYKPDSKSYSKKVS